jgi:hypothetical protein
MRVLVAPPLQPVHVRFAITVTVTLYCNKMRWHTPPKLQRARFLFVYRLSPLQYRSLPHRKRTASTRILSDRRKSRPVESARKPRNSTAACKSGFQHQPACQLLLSSPPFPPSRTPSLNGCVVVVVCTWCGAANTLTQVAEEQWDSLEYSDADGPRVCFLPPFPMLLAPSPG